jgi:hypothetical protein
MNSPKKEKQDWKRPNLNTGQVCLGFSGFTNYCFGEHLWNYMNGKDYTFTKETNKIVRL